MKILVVLALIACASAFELPRVHKLTPRQYRWKMEPRFVDDDKIVGGVAAARGEFPFIVSLKLEQTSWWTGQTTLSHICGGSLIGLDTVLTAAHCTDGQDYTKYTIVAGQHNKASDTDDGTEQTRSVSRIINHPSYSSSTTNYDYAIMKLSSAFTKTSNVDSITYGSCHSGGTCNTNDMVTVAGWGTLSSGGVTPNILQKVSVPIVSNSDCNVAYTGKITNKMMCAGYDIGGKDSCQGDSGGPLIFGSGKSAVLVGIVSWGQGCADAGFPGVYANIQAEKGWIDTNSQ